MKNKTKIRLHLSKNLFETIAKEVLAEAKVNGGGAYTEAVKMPKKAKVDELFGLGGPKAKYKVGQQVKVKGAKGDTEGRETLMYITKVLRTDKDKGSVYQGAEGKGALNQAKYEFHDDQVISETEKVEEMSSKEKMAKGLYKEDAGALQPGENVTWLDGSQREYKGVIQSQEEGDYYKVKITVAPVGGHKVGDVLTKQSGDLKKAMGEMQINVAEEDTLNEIDPSSIDWSAVAAALGAIGLAPFLIDKIHSLWKKKFPKSFEKAQGVSGAISKQAGGNEPDDKEGQVKTGKFESTSLNELRKQIKNK